MEFRITGIKELTPYGALKLQLERVQDSGNAQCGNYEPDAFITATVPNSGDFFNACVGMHVRFGVGFLVEPNNPNYGKNKQYFQYDAYPEGEAAPDLTPPFKSFCETAGWTTSATEEVNGELNVAGPLPNADDREFKYPVGFARKMVEAYNEKPGAERTFNLFGTSYGAKYLWSLIQEDEKRKAALEQELELQHAMNEARYEQDKVYAEIMREARLTEATKFADEIERLEDESQTAGLVAAQEERNQQIDESVEKFVSTVTGKTTKKKKRRGIK